MQEQRRLCSAASFITDIVGGGKSSRSQWKSEGPRAEGPWADRQDPGGEATSLPGFLHTLYSTHTASVGMQAALAPF